jgi:hypothetical protein
MPLVGEIVFDGPLDLPDGQLMIGDLDQSSVLVMDLAEAGPQRIIVCVDDPGYASRVSIGFDVGHHPVPLPVAAGHPLPPALVSDGAELTESTILGLILDDHDAPLARLAAAIKTIPVPGYGDTPAYFPRLAHWLRGLSGTIRRPDADSCAEQIADQMRTTGDFVGANLPDQRAVEIATNALERLELR